MANTVSAASPYVPVEQMNFDNVSTLTPEALLNYCTSRISALDTLINDRFEQQQKGNQMLKDASRLQTLVNGWNGMTDHVQQYADAHKGMAMEFMKLFNDTQDPQLQGLILQKYRMVTGTDMPLDSTGKAAIPTTNGVPDAKLITLNTNEVHGLSPEEWKAKNADIRELQDGHSKENELSMIQLQSVISQRQLAIQLTTQLMQALADGKKQIVNNIKG
jgi:hypothetical protein